ncbi:hypothetical protein LY474_37805 [Myxococcus stipitatus]|uniref:hypothetical protein n=1 Tax=Myxococcus stipitatus TaxID=83455 RepID=UPI001F299D61|nr:hypothetical protein [Myxococcus stipitatus]MCE9673576.1 hypothetical protein [Myxococcus stipitatus]
MELREVHVGNASALKCRFWVDRSGSILVADVDGEYRPGSQGNPDADFLAAKLAEHCAFVRPCALVYDFRDLRYVWGNSLLRIFNASEFMHVDPTSPPFPRVMVVSEACKGALASLCGFDPERPPEWVFEELDAALQYAEVAAQKWLDAP